MISQSKKLWNPENLEPFHLSRRVVPRALSLLLSVELVCSGLVFSAFGSVNLPAFADEKPVQETSVAATSSEAAVAPSWNESKSDSMFINESEPVKKNAKAEAKPEAKPSETKSAEIKADRAPAAAEVAQPVAESKVPAPKAQSDSSGELSADAKAQAKYEAKLQAEMKMRAEAEAKLEAKAAARQEAKQKAEAEIQQKREAKLKAEADLKAAKEAKTAAKAAETRKSIAEIAPVVPAAATADSAVITPAAVSTPTADSAVVVPAAVSAPTTDSAVIVPAAVSAPAAEAKAVVENANVDKTNAEKTNTSDEAIVIDSDVKPEAKSDAKSEAKAEVKNETAEVKVDSDVSPITESTPKPVQAISGNESAHGLEAGSVLSPDGKALLGDAAADSEAPKVGSSGSNGALSTVDSLSADMLVELGASVVETGTSTKDQVAAAGDGPLVIDSDEVDQVEETIKYENLPTDEGKTRIKTGAKFPVVVTSQISSKNAHKGDGLEARLKYDLKIGDRVVAKKGSAVQGHINYALPARSVMHSLMSSNRWYRNSGCLGVEFDEIVTEKGEHLPLVAAPAKAALFIKNKAEGRVLGVNHLGQVAGPWEQQLKYKAVRIGLNAAMAPAGVFSFGAMPVALGLIGAANPSFAFMKPVGTNVRHRRIKGFAWGFLSGVPGSWLIEDTVTKGNEAIIKPGDEFLVEFRQEFTGEPASEAQMLPNANAKVHGDVRTSKKKKP